MRRIALAVVVVLVLLGIWASDTTHPTLELHSPAPGAVGPSHRIEASAADVGWGVRRVLAWVDHEPVELQRGERWTASLSGLSEGVHSVMVCAEDRSLAMGRTCRELTITQDATPPTLQLARASREVAQGHAVGILLHVSEDAELSASFDGRDVALRGQGGGRWLGFTAAGVTQTPGPAPLSVQAVDPAGNATAASFTLNVTETEFPQGGFIQLDARRQANMLDDSKRKEDNDKRAAAYATPSDAWFLVGPLPWPTGGPVSSPFGKVRTYNTGVVRHHLGTDVAAPSGQPVQAPAGGVVTLAEDLHIYGGSVILKHAPDVSTSYNHLSRIDVAVGDVVEPGTVIGLVGSTGQSTGAHLHWGLVVGGIAAAAEQWAAPDWPGRFPDKLDWTRPDRVEPPLAP